ncbi:MAG: hypothetical protein ACRDY0_04480 [Acidimicrobiales bacterium]
MEAEAEGDADPVGEEGGAGGAGAAPGAGDRGPARRVGSGEGPDVAGEGRGLESRRTAAAARWMDGWMDGWMMGWMGGLGVAGAEVVGAGAGWPATVRGAGPTFAEEGGRTGSGAADDPGGADRWTAGPAICGAGGADRWTAGPAICGAGGADRWTAGAATCAGGGAPFEPGESPGWAGPVPPGPARAGRAPVEGAPAAVDGIASSPARPAGAERWRGARGSGAGVAASG